MEYQNLVKLQGSQTVLIVDEDLGFLFWIGELLVEAGYQPVPALNCEQAFNHIQQFEVDIDVVVADAAVRGVSSMLQILRLANSNLRIIITKKPSMDVPQTMPPHAVLEKPAAWDTLNAVFDKPNAWETTSRQEWLRKVKRALREAP